jgi:mitochondrial chaperone BCS1
MNSTSFLGNQSGPSYHSPSVLNILDTFIPGYTLISRLVWETIGLDLSRIVPVLIFGFALIKSIDYIYNQSIRFLIRFATCSVSIDSDADAYFSLMDWLADHSIGKKSSDLIALPLRRPDAYQALAGGLTLDPHSSLMPSPDSKRNKKSQQYEPVLESFQPFWHKGRLFVWFRRRERRQLSTGSYDMPTSLIQGKLFCFSRTTAPLKELIEEASSSYDRKRASKTRIRRPAHKQQRNENGNLWKTVALRPSRPLDTVVLDQEQKDNLVADIREYLRPATRRWYAQRGIPYRRGYVSLYNLI